MTVPRLHCVIALLAGILLVATGCSEQTEIHRTVNAVGAKKLRDEGVALAGGKFPESNAIKIPEDRWPPAVRACRPLSVWLEVDGVYLLIDSDADGERGIFLPRIYSEKDPVCTAKLKHVKLGDGVYWYDRRRTG